jgi:serine/threonine-protein kinase SRPK3
LKVYIRDGHPEEEFKIYQRLSQGNHSHPGYSFIRTALETFKIPRPGGEHACLVQKPMWESLRDLRLRIPDGLFSEELLKGTLQQLFLALDYLHNECNLVHTGTIHLYLLIFNNRIRLLITGALDIKADNILSQIEDTSILDAFVAAEMEHPSPRKTADGVTIYAARQLGIPKRFGNSVLSDFGSAVRGDEKRNHNAGPEIYRVRFALIGGTFAAP